MAVIKIERTVELTGPILTEGLNGTLFTTEGQAHQFTIHCTQGGTAVTLTGTVSAKFIREESNSTILISGSLSNGAAVVTLPADCYHRSGRFSLTIFVTASSVTTCIYSATGSVKAAQAGTLLDTGSVVPDLDTLISMINGKVSKAGDTMTGNLLMNTGNAYPTIGLLRSDSSRGVWIQPNVTGDAKLSIYEYNAAATYYERYDLPTIASNLAANGIYEILTTKQTITKPANGGHAVTSVGGYIQMGKVVLVTMTVVIDTSISEYSVVADSMPASVGYPVLQGYDSSYTAKAFKLDSGKLYALGGASAGTYYINGVYLTA